MPSSVESKARLPRWEGLDTLRAIAVFSVMLYHFPNIFPPGSVMASALTAVDWFGWAGVDLFLVLSGFLIANLLFTEFRAQNKIDFARFWTRRAFKIYPLFYMMLLLCSARLLRMDEPITPRTFLGEALFIQNYAPHIWAHTWSLALEEHFYLIIGLLFIGPLGRFCAPHWRWVVATVAISCLTLRVFGGINQPFKAGRLLYSTHLRLDTLFIGSFVAYLFHYHRDRARQVVFRFRSHLLLGAIFFLCLGFSHQLGQGPFTQTFGLTFLALGFAIIVATIVFGAFSFIPPIASQAILLVGRSSYAIYLWHIITLRNIVRSLHWLFPLAPGYLELLLYLSLAIAIGIIATKWIEAPCLALREKYFPRRGDSNRTPTPPPVFATAPTS